MYEFKRESFFGDPFWKDLGEIFLFSLFAACHAWDSKKIFPLTLFLAGARIIHSRAGSIILPYLHVQVIKQILL
jgi:hypothetical protein